MLQAMRQNTKVILWITVVAFVLLMFFVWGADFMSGSHHGGGPKPGSIGEVNGQSIPYQAYQQELERNSRIARSQGRDLQPSDYLLLQERSWSAVVDRILLIQEAEKRGLKTYDDEIREVMFNDPPPSAYQEPSFYNADQKFDINLYRQAISSPQTPDSYLLDLEAEVRTVLPIQKLTRIIQSGAKVTDDEVRRAYEEQTGKARITYVLVDASHQQIDTEVSDEEIASYFSEHSEEYRLPKRVDLNYISNPRRATAEDSAQIKRDLLDYKKEAEIAARETDSEDSDALDFAALAATFSDGPSADQGGLSAGYLTAAEMTPAFRNALTGVPVGGITEPFKDGAFYHLLQLVDEKEEGGERQVQIRDMALKIDPSDSTTAAIRDQFDQLRAYALDHSLAAAAEKYDLPLQTARNVTADGLVPGLSAVPQVASFALSHDEGTLSRVYATNSGWFLIEIDKVTEAGIPDLSEVGSRVKGDVLDERRSKAAKAVADRLAGAVKLGTPIDEAATAAGLKTADSGLFTRKTGIPGLGRDPEVVAAAFTLPLNTPSDAVRSNRGWVVLRVEERPPVDEADFAKQAPSIRSNLLSVKQSEI